MLFMIIFLPLSIPASWAIDRFGFRKSTGFGAILMALFAVVSAPAGPSFVLVLVGTVGLAIAQPLFMNAWTKVAAHWFPERERATAVGLVTLANLLGIAVGMLASPALAKTHVHRLEPIRLRGRGPDHDPRLSRLSPGKPARAPPAPSARARRPSCWTASSTPCPCRASGSSSS